MASISKADIAKRNNADVMLQRIAAKGSFTVGSTDTGKLSKCTGKVEISVLDKTYKLDLTKKKDYEHAVGLLATYLQRKNVKDKFNIELMAPRAKFMSHTKLFKDKDFGGVAGKSSGGGSERQELSLIDLINDSVKEGESFIRALGGNTNPVIRASKNDGLSAAKQEPYIDVYIETKKKKYGISCKGNSAPSLAGGGLVGLQIVVPDLMERLMRTIKDDLQKEFGLVQDTVIDANTIPDLFIKVPESYMEKILVGNEHMGGPIDYMYVGDMTVRGDRKNSGEISILNGNFYDIDSYMRKVKDLYFRIRKRDLPTDKMIRIDYETKQLKSGYPVMFGSVGGSKTKTHMRIVLTDSVPSTGKKIKLL